MRAVAQGQWITRPAAHALRRAGESLVVLVLLVALWQFAASTSVSPYFPPPSDVLHQVYENWLSAPASDLFLTADFRNNALPSLTRLALAWLLAAGVGVLAGTAIGSSRRLADYVAPLIEFLRSIPPPALLPIFLILFGATSHMRVFFIAFGVVWFVLLNTIAGVHAVEQTQLETGEVFKIDRRRRLTHIILPAAAPSIYAGLRISLSSALILMVISELLGSTNGIGFEILQAQRSFEILDMWAGMVLLGILGYLLNTVLYLSERRTLAWHRGARARNA